jgi:6-phosphogluconolactonase
MKTFASLASGIMLTALMTLAGAAQAATFVYVSNAEDGDIGTYTLLPDGSLVPGPRVAAGKPVMPMSVSPDRRFLYAAVRSKPFTVVTYSMTGRPASSTSGRARPWPRASRTSRWTRREASCSARPTAATSSA